MPNAPPTLTIKQILAWADAHHARTGKWPTMLSGLVHEAPHETWDNINQAMYVGRRGFRPKQTLAKLLAERRGRRHRMKPGGLSVEQILRWADDFYQRTGSWPKFLGADPGND